MNKEIEQILNDLENEIQAISVESHTGGYEDRVNAIETLNKLKLKLFSIPVVSVSFIEQVKQQIEYHKEQETNRSKVKDYSQAIYHDNRRGALEDLLLWIKLNER